MIQGIRRTELACKRDGEFRYEGQPLGSLQGLDREGRVIAARRRVLLDSIRESLGDRVDVTGDGAGAHIVLWPRRRVDEQAVIASAAARGVGVYGISRYFLKPPSRTGIMLGYSRMRESEIQAGIRRLSEVL